MAGKKKSAAASNSSVAELPAGGAPDAAALDAAGRFVGQWNRLVSTTNWEKGRIICQWRDALVAAGAAVTEYSDEAWTQLVGGVTSQHVGRLRRVFQRFGETSDQYEGLYWSHFQAAIDWEDAEMWLEGAIHNGWSVSQMRGKRWETLGKPGDAPTVDDSAEAYGLEGVDEAPFDAADAPVDTAMTTPASDGAAKRSTKSADADDADADDEEASSSGAADHGGRDDGERAAAPAKSRTRLAVEVDQLPDDLADAFEQFKLAIIAQRRLGWSETTPEIVLECLDALRELALAPAED
jgi:hypothetical protein